MLTYDFIKKYNKIIAVILALVLVLGGAYQNLSHANSLIDQKKDTYKEIKLAGEWLKENSASDAKVITASIVQNQYYSERQSYDFYTNDTIWKECTDLLGNLLLNETCQKETENVFNKKVEIVKPDYLIVSLFEPTFTPQWAYDYPQRYNLTKVQAYFDDKNQLLLVIYKF